MSIFVVQHQVRAWSHFLSPQFLLRCLLLGNVTCSDGDKLTPHFFLGSDLWSDLRDVSGFSCLIISVS